VCPVFLGEVSRQRRYSPAGAWIAAKGTPFLPVVSLIFSWRVTNEREGSGSGVALSQVLAGREKFAERPSGLRVDRRTMPSRRDTWAFPTQHRHFRAGPSRSVPSTSIREPFRGWSLAVRSFRSVQKYKLIGPHCCITSSTTALLPLSTLMTLCTGAYPVRVMSIT
jgi:hypothetical protein